MRGIWFCLLANGELMTIGDCGDFDCAEEIAVDLACGEPIIWILDQETAEQWAARLNANLPRGTLL